MTPPARPAPPAPAAPVTPGTTAPPAPPVSSAVAPVSAAPPAPSAAAPQADASSGRAPSAAASSRPPTFAGYAVKWWVGLLCVLGMLRVLAFCAAYPVLDYVDEGLHLDVVLTFARVGVPGPGDDFFDPDAARIIATYGVGAMNPPYELPYAHLSDAERRRAVAAEADRLRKYRNAEVFAPPLYYGVAAAWYRLGQLLGLRDLALAYWLRFLSVPLYGGAMWLACRTCTAFHPGRPALAVATAVILAALPQDILYTINSDVFSPLAVTLALYLLLRWLHAPRPSLALSACAGAAVSAAMLGKYSNVGAFAVVPVVLLLALRRRRRREPQEQEQQPPRRPSAAEVATLLLCAAVPLGLWMLRCQVVFGDWTALEDKYAQIRWTVLPLSESLKHPIFGPLGVLEFLNRLCLTFWRGEIIWANFIQRLPAADVFYRVVTALGVVGVAGWLLRPSPAARPERRNAVVYLTAVAAQVVFLGLISTRFDYANFFFPSRGFPYFAAGRLLTGVLAPFAILLAGGLGELLAFTGRRNAMVWAAAVIAVVCLGSEIYLCCFATDANVFASPHNFYSLLLGRR